MRRLFMISAVLASNFMAAFSQGATGLFISEYVEGSSNNKYIEVFNGTGQSVDLVDYQLKLYSNGAPIPTNSSDLSGALANGEVMVFKHTSAEVYLGLVNINTACNFNGDDAIALFRISTNALIDIFGCIGMDPGTDWVMGVNRTVDKTLVRKSNVASGVSQNPMSGFPTLDSEWDMFDADVVSSLGNHVFSPVISRLVDENPKSDLKLVLISNNRISISSAKNISSVRLVAVNGCELVRVEEAHSTFVALPQMQCGYGLCVVMVEFEDGTIERKKMILR